MTIVYPASPFTNPSNCDHWQLSATITTDDDSSVSVQTPVIKSAYSTNDPVAPESLGIRTGTLRGLTQYVCYLESRRLGKAAGAATFAQLNLAVKNQTVVL